MMTRPADGTPASISLDPVSFLLDVVAPPSIVVINLDRRPQRWQALQQAWPAAVSQHFARLAATDGQSLPNDRIEAYRKTRAVPSERAAGELGCCDSWLRAIRKHGPALYFEDDARPCDPWPYGSPPDDAEIVLLGGELWHKTTKPGWISAASGVNGTHAVWVRTARAAAELLAVWQNETRRSGPVDFVWNSALRRCNAVVAAPQIICQANLGTDVQFGVGDRPGGPPLTRARCSL